MSFNPAGFLFFAVLVAIPAYFINKWLLKITRPKKSPERLLLYFLLSLLAAFAYSVLFILVFTRIYPLAKK